LLPGRINEVSLGEEKTVQAAVEAAEIEGSGHEVRVNGEPSEMDAELQTGDTVLLIREVRGN
jgi:hypothetical protein